MTIAYTIVNIKYLPVAKTLVDSFMKHNQNIPIYICFFDDKKNIEDPIFLDYNIYDKNNLDQEEYEDMRRRYTDFSMASSLKPFFGEALIRDFNPEYVIYLDADIKVFNSLEKIEHIFRNQEQSIILTGHQYAIIPTDNELQINQRFRKYGIYNAGFFAFKNNEAGNLFLKWWRRMLFTKCIGDTENGVFYDQSWLDLVTIYFADDLYLLQDLGYNVAFWNLQERRVSIIKGNYTINNEFSLVFYHFARFKYYEDSFMEGFNISTDQYPIIEIIFSEYKRELKSNLFEKYIFPLPKQKKITLKEKIKNSLKYRITLLIDKL